MEGCCTLTPCDCCGAGGCRRSCSRACSGGTCGVNCPLFSDPVWQDIARYADCGSGRCDVSVGVVAVARLSQCSLSDPPSLLLLQSTTSSVAHVCLHEGALASSNYCLQGWPHHSTTYLGMASLHRSHFQIQWLDSDNTLCMHAQAIRCTSKRVRYGECMSHRARRHQSCRPRTAPTMTYISLQINPWEYLANFSSAGACAAT